MDQWFIHCVAGKDTAIACGGWAISAATAILDSSCYVIQLGNECSGGAYHAMPILFRLYLSHRQGKVTVQHRQSRMGIQNRVPSAEVSHATETHLMGEA